MKAFELAVLMEIGYAVLITVLFRVWPFRRRAGSMLGLFVVTLPIFVVAYVLSPPEVGLRIPGFEEPPLWLGLGFGLLLYGAGFCGGILQIYNLAERGFSLRLLIDLDEAEGGFTLEDFASRYSAGRGIQWMYEKRLQDLLDGDIITVDEAGVVRTRPRGARIALIFSRVRGFLRLGEAELESPWS